MKRRVEETTKVEGVPPALHSQRSPHTAPNVVQPTYPAIAKGGGPPDVNSIQQYPLAAASFVTMPSITASVKTSGGLQGGNAPHSSGILVTSQFRHNKVPSSGGTTPPTVVGSAGAPNVSGPTQQFQRLKVEDALSYLDQVKYKFNSQPQVYNDFLEIMKEFKSQCIDTPGVIARVSHLFKGYPELISGFNTFLPPGYKIEVQANDTGYSLQVSVSNPLGHQTMTEIPPLTPTQQHSVVVTNQTNKPPTNYTSVVGGSSTVVTTTNVVPTVSSTAHLVKATSGVPPTVERAPPPAALSISGPPERTPAIATVSSLQGAQVLTGAASISTAAVLAAASPSVPAATNLSTANHQAGQQQTNQPVEFNHAINYVNKIKNRFQGQPDKYKKFLEILHTYQKEQKNVKSGSGGSGVGVIGAVSAGKHLTEAEVYSQVAQLFENHDDLLVEFGQFLPDATSHNSLSLASLVHSSTSNHHVSFGLEPKIAERKMPHSINKYSSGSSNRIEGNGRERERDRNERDGRDVPTKTSPPSSASKAISGTKRSNELFNSSSIGPNSPGSAHHGPPGPVKRPKFSHSSSHSYSHFEAIKRAFRNPAKYDHLLRCFHLFNIEIISKAELVDLISPLLARLPDHLNYFKEYLGETGPVVLPSDSGRSSAPVSPPPPVHHPIHLPTHLNTIGPPPIPGITPIQDSHPLSNNRISSESRSDLGTTASTADIDFSTCKRIGASYCALPKNAPPPRCSGRTSLCRQVLNDTWVSFPTWSEDSTFVTSRKTQYEEYIYRCEDERFELDLVIESNAATILVLENVQKKMSRMTPEELSKFTLEDNLGGTSNTIHTRAIKRIYGDKAADIVEGLKLNPSVSVPLVLRRLRSKENEWRHAQKGFNKTWRDQNEKFYLKSLDHQGINFKQNDLKALRSKSLYNEIETLYDERHESEDPRTGPHIHLTYTDKNILDDAANLLIHHVKRQTAIHKQDKQRIKQLLRHSIPDMFHHRRQELSDDERDPDDKMDSDVSTNKENLGNAGNTQGTYNNNNVRVKRESGAGSPVCTTTRTDGNFKSSPNSSLCQDPSAVLVKQEEHPTKFPDEVYTLFFGNNNWYLFLRLHQILCDRLAKMSERSVKIAEEEAQHSLNRKESTTAMLRLKPNEQWQDCYGSMLDMVKSVLDCSMESQSYEDTLRNMFGIHAYIGFTLDKIVTYAVRQLQHLVTEESCVECWDLHNTFRGKGGAGGPVMTADERAAVESCYMRAATSMLSNDNCYKIHIYKKECKVTVELLDTESEEEEGGGSDSAIGGNPGKGSNSGHKWTEFDNRLGNTSTSEKADSGVSLSDKDRYGPPPPLFLNRAVRRVKKNFSDPSNSKQLNPEKCLGTGSHNNVFVIEKSDILKTGCITRARESHCRVSRSKFTKFYSWYNRWSQQEISRSDVEATNVWFMGRSPNSIPNVTKAVENDPGDRRPPYRKYNLYTVCRTSNS
uniref:Paired amphipathic helix protein Sin3a n=3 Tax=Lygus hesperus TaxID=30085 RepID=A0A146LA21_LYGHE